VISINHISSFYEQVGSWFTIRVLLVEWTYINVSAGWFIVKLPDYSIGVTVIKQANFFQIQLYKF